MFTGCQTLNINKLLHSLKSNHGTNLSYQLLSSPSSLIKDSQKCKKPVSLTDVVVWISFKLYWMRQSDQRRKYPGIYHNPNKFVTTKDTLAKQFCKTYKKYPNYNTDIISRKLSSACPSELWYYIQQ